MILLTTQSTFDRFFNEKRRRENWYTCTFSY